MYERGSFWPLEVVVEAFLEINSKKNLSAVIVNLVHMFVMWHCACAYVRVNRLPPSRLFHSISFFFVEAKNLHIFLLLSFFVNSFSMTLPYSLRLNYV